MLYVLIICVWTELFHTKRRLWEYISLTSSSPLACASFSVSVDFRKRRGSKLTGFLIPKIFFSPYFDHTHKLGGCHKQIHHHE